MKKYAKLGTGFITLSLLVILLLSSNITNKITKDSTIKEDELLMYATPYKASVRSVYQEKIGYELSEEEFWNYSIDGTTPKKELIKKAKELAFRATAIQNWAIEEDIESAKEYVYSSSVKWEDYHYLLSEWEIALKKILGKTITDQTLLKSYYQENIERYRRADTIEGTLYIWEQGRVVSSEEIRVDANNIKAMTEENEEVIAYFQELEPGEEISWGNGPDGYYQLICDSREKGGYIPFEEMVQAVHAQYVDELFEEELRERIKILKTQMRRVCIKTKFRTTSFSFEIS